MYSWRALLQGAGKPAWCWLLELVPMRNNSLPGKEAGQKLVNLRSQECKDLIIDICIVFSVQQCPSTKECAVFLVLQSTDWPSCQRPPRQTGQLLTAPPCSARSALDRVKSYQDTFTRFRAFIYRLCAAARGNRTILYGKKVLDFILNLLGKYREESWVPTIRLHWYWEGHQEWSWGNARDTCC